MVYVYLAILFLILLIAVLGIAVFIVAFPLIGALLLSVAGIRLKAPKWWFILTGILGFCFTVVNIVGSANDNTRIAFFSTLIIFGIYALVSIAVLLCSRKKAAREAPCNTMDASAFPNDDTETECETALSETVATRYIEILNDDIGLLATTTNPCTFFGRYHDALSAADRIIRSSHLDSRVEYAMRKRAYLIDSKDRICTAFVDRCREKGTLYSMQSELLSGDSILSPSVKQYVTTSLEQLAATDPQPPKGGKYIYCSVIFSEGGKSYYYKTDDTTLSCGDEVIVPVGNEGTKKSVGKITNIEYVLPGETPYPPGMTKDILGKCSYYADEKTPESE